MRLRHFPICRVLLAVALAWIGVFRRGEHGAAELPAEFLRRPPPYRRFEDKPLKELLGELQKAAGVPIEVDWPGLAKVGVPADQRITLEITESTVGLALGYVLCLTNARGGLQFCSEAGRMVVVPAGEGRGVACRAFDVGDLLDAFERLPKSERSADGFSLDWQERWRFNWQGAGESLWNIGYRLYNSTGFAFDPQEADEAFVLFIRLKASEEFDCRGGLPYEGGRFHGYSRSWIWHQRLFVIAPPNGQEQVASLLAHLRRHPRRLERESGE